MFENEIGVTADADGSYTRDYAFWDAFDTPTDTDVIPSLEVPQADSIQTLQYVLQAIADWNTTKHTIQTAVAPEMNGFDPRQADYYGIAGWLLGFIHKDKRVQCDTGEIRRWGLTRRGNEYIEYLTDGQSTDARTVLQDGVREIEIIQRILARVERDRVVQRQDVVELIASETELNETTASRRESSIRSWIAVLPEVTIKRESSITYYYTSHGTDWFGTRS